MAIISGSTPIEVQSDVGKGRAIIVLCEKGTYNDFAEKLSHELHRDTRVISCITQRVGAQNWQLLTLKLEEALQSLGVRQATYIGFGPAATVVQNLVILKPKLVRSLVLVDATMRAHPTLWQCLSDRIERFLPLGLPLRFRSADFDGHPLLHRMRCPALIVTSRHASQLARSQASEFASSMPSAWREVLVSENEARELTELVVQFQNVPAKAPQRAA